MEGKVVASEDCGDVWIRHGKPPGMEAHRK